MAKRDWTKTYTDEWGGTTYSLSLGNRACDIRAFGTWRQYCQLLFYLRDKKTHSWYRVTRSGEDWYENEDRGEIPEYPTCGQAEKVALKWLLEAGKDSPADGSLQKRSLQPRMDPGRARQIASVNGKTLYRSKSGVFFMTSSWNDDPSKIPEKAAREWVKKNCSPILYSLVFDDKPPVRVSLMIPAALLSLIDTEINDMQRSRSSVVVKGLEQYFSQIKGKK